MKRRSVCCVFSSILNGCNFYSVAVLLQVAVAHAQIQVNINQPAPNAAASGALYVQVNISSVYELSSVTAQVEGRQANLRYSQPLNAWTNSVPLTGLSFGSHTLVVNAQDFFGGTAQAVRSFSVDNPPILTVVAPLNDTVAPGLVYIEATATDDGPLGAVIKVYSQYRPSNPVPVLIGTNKVSGVVTAYDFFIPIVFEAVDSSGQKQFIARRVVVAGSSNLVEIATAPGRILDIIPSRTLYAVSADVPLASPPQFGLWPFGVSQPRIVEHDSGDVLIPSSLPSDPAFGFAGSSGVLLGYPPPGGFYYSVWYWNGQDVKALGPIIGGSNNVFVVGNTAAWRWDQPNGPDTVTLMDLTDTDRQFVLSFPYVETNQALTTIAAFCLAPNYDLVYSVSNHVYRSRPASAAEPYLNRTTSRLTSTDNGGIYGVASDGTNVVYSVLTSSQPLTLEIRLISSSGEEFLAGWPSINDPAIKSVNGWVAYSKPGSAGQAQVWTRSPAGTQQQRTFLSSSSTLESLGPGGEITFLNNNARYVSLPGVLQPIWVNSGQGRVHWDDGKLLVILGRSVLEFRMGQLQCTALGGGGTQLTFTGPNGLSYKVQSSADLQNWSDMWTFAHTTGTISWTNQPASAHNFYRAVTAPAP